MITPLSSSQDNSDFSIPDLNSTTQAGIEKQTELDERFHSIQICMEWPTLQNYLFVQASPVKYAMLPCNLFVWKLTLTLKLHHIPSIFRGNSQSEVICRICWENLKKFEISRDPQTRWAELLSKSLDRKFKEGILWSSDPHNNVAWKAQTLHKFLDSMNYSELSALRGMWNQNHPHYNFGEFGVAKSSIYSNQFLLFASISPYPSSLRSIPSCPSVIVTIMVISLSGRNDVIRYLKLTFVVPSIETYCCHDKMPTCVRP